MSTSNNTNKGKSMPPINDLMRWTDVALAENNSDDKVLTTRKFQECQQRRAEKKQKEEQKKAEEEWKRAEEAKKVEEARKVVEVKKVEEVWKAAEAKKATALARGALTAGGGQGHHRQKMGYVYPEVEKKERRRKWEEPTSPRSGSNRKQTWVWSPEVEDDEEEEDKDALQLIARVIDGLMQELKEMWWEYWKQGKWVVTAIDDLQHKLDLEYVAGPEEESDPEVLKEEMAEASVELGELRKEAEVVVEELEDEGSDDDKV
ncbi:hypothetical protein HYDPIDRAFT_24398 [Hydnomerulius pinastri MD-312]|uniref:Uncharacterized protein n=1 Tax=Hydnomerulius pinastri MD-312 TaxID=994086 RepID=A0A0C9VNA4_9AGAM|nr:hypothetical protein HYDPIDRAFT_33488 [Hydnomerulius pinastri MD-312]KIJ69565.1 hypothetical protein HYDPIDRAFT_24398 [Hydnomerulius pinastri MD-312]